MAAVKRYEWKSDSREIKQSNTQRTQDFYMNTPECSESLWGNMRGVYIYLKGHCKEEFCKELGDLLHCLSEELGNS